MGLHIVLWMVFTVVEHVLVVDSSLLHTLSLLLQRQLSQPGHGFRSPHVEHVLGQTVVCQRIE